MEVAIFRKREPRREVLVKARMRVGNDWRDVSIRNVSSRGMMLATDEPPPPGAYIEIRKAMMVIVARAVWVRDGFFGIRTQDRVDFDELLENAAARSKSWKPGAEERRAADRRAAHRPEEIAEQARRRARLIQFAILIGGVATAAILIATEVHKLLAQPFAAIAAALS